MTSIKPTIPTSNGIAQYRAKLRKAGTEIDEAAACQAKAKQSKAATQPAAPDEIQFN
jgi:hypothetical protein